MGDVVVCDHYFNIVVLVQVVPLSNFVYIFRTCIVAGI